MAQSYTIGRVTADFELQTSANMNPYVRFSLAEHIGYGESARTQYLQVWAWGEDAKRLIKGKVKKGSLLWVSGQLELEEFVKQDGTTADKRLKVTLDNWGYIPAGKPKEAGSAQPDDESPPPMSEPIAEIDGDRDTLPE
jgi:single-stranded DNA-binding protein